MVWVTHPVYFPALRRLLKPGQTLIYDCMDDALEFPGVKGDAKLTAFLSEQEQGLLDRCQHVFASSDHLARRLEQRYRVAAPITVVNNAIFLYEGVPDAARVASRDATRGVRIAYIGTISEWLDFPLILRSLEANAGVVYDLSAPVAAGVAIPRHERIVHHGPIQHAEVFAAMARSDLLVMPFVVNELIRSVNPVKLYEYIYSGVPTLAVRYGETEKFAPYAYLYENADEFLRYVQLVAQGALPARKTPTECVEYARQSPWASRARAILDVLGLPSPST